MKNLIRYGMTSSKGSENINTCCPSLWDRRHKASVSGNCFQEMLHHLQLSETLQNKSNVTFFSFSAILFAVLVLYHYRPENPEKYFLFRKHISERQSSRTPAGPQTSKDKKMRNVLLLSKMVAKFEDKLP